MTLIRHSSNPYDTVVSESTVDIIQAFVKAGPTSRLPTDGWAELTLQAGGIEAKKKTAVNPHLLGDIISNRTVGELRTALGVKKGEEVDFETLLWMIGELRRRTEDAHSRLDLMDAPRKNDKEEVYSLSGRLMCIQEKM